METNIFRVFQRLPASPMRGLGHALAHIADIPAGRAAAPCGTATDWLAVITPGVLTLGLALWSLRVGRASQPAK